MRARRPRVGLVVAAVLVAAALHAATPAGPHSWHGLHVLLQKLYYAPILMASAWLGLGPALATTLAVSALYTVHVLGDWAGLPMVHWNQAVGVRFEERSDVDRPRAPR